MTVTPPELTSEGRLQEGERTAEGIWYLFAISGAVSAVIGILVLAYPDPSVKLLGVFLGIDLVIAGIVLILRGVTGGSDAEAGPAGILLGALALIAGVVVIRNPDKSIVLLTVAFALYLIVVGAVTLGHGIVNREHRAATLGRGAFLVLVGTVIVSWPDISVKTLAVLAGIALLLQGALEIAEAFFLRSALRAAER